MALDLLGDLHRLRGHPDIWSFLPPGDIRAGITEAQEDAPY